MGVEIRGGGKKKVCIFLGTNEFLLDTRLDQNLTDQAGVEDVKMEVFD